MSFPDCSRRCHSSLQPRHSFPSLTRSKVRTQLQNYTDTQPPQLKAAYRASGTSELTFAAICSAPCHWHGNTNSATGAPQRATDIRTKICGYAAPAGKANSAASNPTAALQPAAAQPLTRLSLRRPTVLLHQHRNCCRRQALKRQNLWLVRTWH